MCGWRVHLPHTVLLNGLKPNSWGRLCLCVEKLTFPGIRWVTLGTKNALSCLCSEANPPTARDGKVALSNVVFHCGGCSRGLILICSLRQVPAKNSRDILFARLWGIIHTLHILRFMCHLRDNTALWSYCFALKRVCVSWVGPRLCSFVCVWNLSHRTQTSWRLGHPGTGQTPPPILVPSCPPACRARKRHSWTGWENAGWVVTITTHTSVSWISYCINQKEWLFFRQKSVCILVHTHSWTTEVWVCCMLFSCSPGERQHCMLLKKLCC